MATNKAAELRMIRARTALTMDPRTAYFASIALELKLVERESVKTMATDSKHLFYAPSYVLGKTEPVLLGTVVHECEHVARLHFARRGNRDLKLWNQACDYAINPDVLRNGFKLPDGILIDPRFTGMSPEAIYAELARAAQPQQQPQQQPGNDQQQQPQQSGGAGAGKPQPGKQEAKPGAGAPQPGQDGKPQPGQGSPQPGGAGQSGAPQPGKPGDHPGAGKPDAGAQPQPGGAGKPDGAESLDGCGGILDAGETVAEIQQAAAEWEIKIRRAAMVAKAAGAGKMPGSVAEIINDLDGARARIDWRAELRRFADESSIKDSSWSRPNRRFAYSGLILPGPVSDAPSHIVFVVDTSGSMDSAALASVGAEMQAALDARAMERLTVVECDTKVNRSRSYEPGDVVALDFRGRGGTRFAPAFEWISDNAHDASAIVYLTDLDCEAFGEEPGAPVLWARTGDGRHAKRPPFGEIVPIDPHA